MRKDLAIIAFAMTLVCIGSTTARAAGACDQLKGQYVAYSQSGAGGNLALNFIDFSKQGVSHSVYMKPQATTVPDGQSQVYPTSAQVTLDKVSRCRPGPGATKASLTFLSGGSADIVLVDKGNRFSLEATHPNDKGMKGWAFKVPSRP
jgi:hypothetical protein